MSASIETFLTLWEVVLGEHTDWVEHHGVAHARYKVAASEDVVNACDEGWKILQGEPNPVGNLDTFDFDFVPWFVNHCVEITPGWFVLRDNWKSIVQELIDSTSSVTS